MAAPEGSDLDLIVEVPRATSSFAFIRFKQLVEQILGREVDLISYGGLAERLDDEIRWQVVACARSGSEHVRHVPRINARYRLAGRVAVEQGVEISRQSG